jgi:GntR family transcriptional regulator
VTAMLGAEAGMIEAIRSRLAAAKATTTPKYQTLHSAILAAISSGQWIAGARLPTEAELAEVLPYSLGTIQKAYGELVKNGLVLRARGRGSFVVPLHRQMAEPWHCRFLADDGAVLPVYPHLLGATLVRRDARLAELFGAAAKISRIDRLISINDEFNVLSRFFTTAAVAKSLLRGPRAEVESVNFKTVLLRELGMPIVRIAQTVAPAGDSSKKICRQMGLKAEPFLVIEATGHAAQGNVVYFQEIHIPRSRRKLLFDSDLK